MDKWTFASFAFFPARAYNVREPFLVGWLRRLVFRSPEIGLRKFHSSVLDSFCNACEVVRIPLRSDDDLILVIALVFYRLVHLPEKKKNKQLPTEGRRVDHFEHFKHAIILPMCFFFCVLACCHRCSKSLSAPISQHKMGTLHTHGRWTLIHKMNIIAYISIVAEISIVQTAVQRTHSERKKEGEREWDRERERARENIVLAYTFSVCLKVLTTADGHTRTVPFSTFCKLSLNYVHNCALSMHNDGIYIWNVLLMYTPKWRYPKHTHSADTLQCHCVAFFFSSSTSPTAPFVSTSFSVSICRLLSHAHPAVMFDAQKKNKIGYTVCRTLWLEHKYTFNANTKINVLSFGQLVVQKIKIWTTPLVCVCVCGDGNVNRQPTQQ